MDRRKLLSFALNGTGAVIAGTVVGPALLSSLTPALNSAQEPDWQGIGLVEEFKIGHVHTTDVATRGIFVWRRSDDEVVVFSRACTDLGCPLTWDSGSTWFYCPCHGGIFNAEGEPMHGPPKRPLWRYNTRIRDGLLEVDMRSVPPMA